jgi:hypothetical protein
MRNSERVIGPRRNDIVVRGCIRTRFGDACVSRIRNHRGAICFSTLLKLDADFVPPAQQMQSRTGRADST